MIEIKDFSALENPMIRSHLRGSMAFYCYNANDNPDKIKGGVIYLDRLAVNHPRISLFAVINHEFMHKVLHEVIDKETAMMYDNIADGGELDMLIHGW